MKKFSTLLLLFMLFAGSSTGTYAQDTLPGVTVISMNYKYIKSAYDTNAAQPVRMLQRRAAGYDLRSSDFYEDEYDDFFISFYIPEGKLLANYDKDGKLLRTAERYKNVALPPAVRQSVTTRFPGWAISKDVYLVNFYTEAKSVRKVYKLLLENGNKRMRVRTNDVGEFLD